jgi:hypothetical protein
MIAKKQFSIARLVSIGRRRAHRQIPMISILFLLLGAAGVAQASAYSANQLSRPANPQKSPSLDQILDNITESGLDHQGLDQSNLAIDQLVQKANQLMRNATKERNKELAGKNPNSPASQVLGQAIFTLTNACSYLQELKELQNALIAVQAPAAGAKADAHQICKDLNLQFKAVGTDLSNLKLSIQSLPFPQKIIADLIIWDMQGRLDSAILRIRQRTLQVGKALKLESELPLEAR